MNYQMEKRNVKKKTTAKLKGGKSGTIS